MWFSPSLSLSITLSLSLPRYIISSCRSGYDLLLLSSIWGICLPILVFQRCPVVWCSQATSNVVFFSSYFYHSGVHIPLKYLPSLAVSLHPFSPLAPPMLSDSSPILQYDTSLPTLRTASFSEPSSSCDHPSSLLHLGSPVVFMLTTVYAIMCNIHW